MFPRLTTIRWGALSHTRMSAEFRSSRTRERRRRIQQERPSALREALGARFFPSRLRSKNVQGRAVGMPADVATCVKAPDRWSHFGPRPPLAFRRREISRGDLEIWSRASFCCSRHAKSSGDCAVDAERRRARPPNSRSHGSRSHDLPVKSRSTRRGLSWVRGPVTGAAGGQLRDQTNRQARGWRESTRRLALC